MADEKKAAPEPDAELMAQLSQHPQTDAAAAAREAGPLPAVETTGPDVVEMNDLAAAEAAAKESNK